MNTIRLESKYHPELIDDYVRKFDHFLNSHRDQFFLYSVLTFHDLRQNYLRRKDTQTSYDLIYRDVKEFKKYLNKELFLKPSLSNLEFLFTIEEFPRFHVNMLMTEPHTDVLRHKYRDKFNFTRTKNVIERLCYRMSNFHYSYTLKTFDLDPLKSYVTKEIRERNNLNCIDFENSDLTRYENNTYISHHKHKYLFQRLDDQ